MSCSPYAALYPRGCCLHARLSKRLSAAFASLCIDSPTFGLVLACLTVVGLTIVCLMLGDQERF